MPRKEKYNDRKSDRISRNLSRLDNDLRDLQRNDDRGRFGPIERPKKLIEKPQGQPGRSQLKGGYNLQEAMGLGGDSRKYNAFRMIARRYANRYLDPEQTIRHQSKLAVSHLLTFAQRKHAFMAKFRDNWPFNDFLATYLRNHVQYAKTRGSDDSDDEMNGLDDEALDDILNDKGKRRRVDTSDTKDSDDSEREMSASPRPRQKKRRHEDEVSTQPRKKIKCVPEVLLPAPARHGAPLPRSRPAPARREAPPPPQSCPAPAHPRSRFGPKSIQLAAAAPVGATGLKLHLKPAPKAKPVANSGPAPPQSKLKPKPMPTAPKAKPVANPGPAPPQSKPKPKPMPTAPKAKPKPKQLDHDDEYEFADLPLFCPSDGCKDPVPADPSTKLASQLRQWNRFVQKNLCLTREALGLELDICGALRLLREVKMSKQRANARGWKTAIVWETVSERVLKMEEDLRVLIFTPDGRRYNFFHDLIVEDLRLGGLESSSADREFSKLATTPRNKIPNIITMNARPGYYGEKGFAIIQSAIFSMFDHEETPNDAFAPINFKMYIEFYLIPWVAMNLISEDLECSLETAYEEMIASGDSGTALHPMSDNDTKIEGIISHHCVLAADKRIAKIERFHDEMKSEIEKAKQEKKMEEDLAAKLVSKQRARGLKSLTSSSKSQHQTVALPPPSAGPSKFPGSYGDGDSELSDLPESIHASPSPPRKLPPRAARKARK